MTGVDDHLERFLGEIEGGWSHDADGSHMPFQVVRFSTGSVPGSITFSTLGLGRSELHSRASGREVHQELLMVVPESLRDGPVPGILQQLGTELLRTGHGLLRGDVIGPGGLLFVGSRMEAMYAASPVLFPDAFAICREGDHDVVIVWLVPVSGTEAAFVREYGCDAFEDRLVEADPDLVDVFREPMLI